MAKKDFSDMDGVFESIDRASGERGQQAIATPQEQEQRAQQLKTQGRKGCKAARMNMAFTPDNYTYVRVMAKVTGKTLTDFVNLVLERYRNEHPELYVKAKEILDAVMEEP